MRKSLWLGMVLVYSGIAQGAQTGKVGQDVLEAIEAKGEANVVIALAKPPSWIPPHILARRSAVPHDTPDLSRLRREITRLVYLARQSRQRAIHMSLCEVGSVQGR